MELLVIGVSHRTAALALREKASLAGDAHTSILRALARDSRVHEAVALSTCNRTELYAAVRSRDEGALALLFALVRETQVGFDELSRAHYALSGQHAVVHLLRVAASLDSMVLGESEIQGQVRQAVARAEEAGTAGRTMRELFRRALVTGKRVRRSTGIGRGSVSVSQAAVESAVRGMPDLGFRRALLVGAGKAGEATARALVARGLGQMVVLNRSQQTARRLANRFGGQGASLDRLERELAVADIVVCSTDSPTPLISAAAVTRALRGRPDRDLVLIDIAVPRDVEPALRGMPGVLLLDLDDLEAVVREHHHDRVREAARAEVIVRDEARRYAGPAHALAPLPLQTPCVA